MRTRTQRDYVNRKAQIGKRVREEAIQIVKRQREAALETRVEEKAQRKAEAKYQRILRRQKNDKKKILYVKQERDEEI